MDEKPVSVTPPQAAPSAPETPPASPQAASNPSPSQPAAPTGATQANPTQTSPGAAETPVKKSSRKKLFIILFVLVDMILVAYIAYHIMMPQG